VKSTVSFSGTLTVPGKISTGPEALGGGGGGDTAPPLLPHAISDANPTTATTARKQFSTPLVIIDPLNPYDFSIGGDTHHARLLRAFSQTMSCPAVPSQSVSKRLSRA